MEIEVRLTIKEVDNWVVNWRDKSELEDELKNLKNQIEEALSQGLGVNISNIQIDLVQLW